MSLIPTSVRFGNRQQLSAASQFNGITHRFVLQTLELIVTAI